MNIPINNLYPYAYVICIISKPMPKIYIFSLYIGNLLICNCIHSLEY